MALDFIQLGASEDPGTNNAVDPDLNDGSNLDSYVGPSWTPPSSGLLLAFVQSRVADTSPTTPTISGNGLTWVQIGSTLDCDGNGNGLSLFIADLSGSTTGSYTVDFGAVGQVHCTVSLFYVTGADLSGGVANAIVQNQTNTGTGTGGSVTLNAFGAADNRAAGCFWHIADETSSPGTDWTKNDNLYGSGQTRSVITIYREAAQDTLPDASWATSSDWAGFAIEVKAQVAESAQQTRPRRPNRSAQIPIHHLQL